MRFSAMMRFILLAGLFERCWQTPKLADNRWMVVSDVSIRCPVSGAHNRMGLLSAAAVPNRTAHLPVGGSDILTNARLARRRDLRAIKLQGQQLGPMGPAAYHTWNSNRPLAPCSRSSRRSGQVP